MKSLATRITHLAMAGAMASTPIALSAAASLSISACGGATNVAQGLRYAAGEPTYDAFFDQLYEVQLRLGQAPEKEAQARQELATVVGASDSTTKPLLSAVKKQTQRMAGEGLTLAMTASEPGKPAAVDLAITAGLAEPKDQRVIDGIKKAAQTEATLVAEMRESRTAIEQLKEQLPQLKANIDAAFRKNFATKNEVQANLQDAEKLIPFMEKRAEEVGTLAEQVLDGLVEVANTTPEASPEAGEVEELPETPGGAQPAPPSTAPAPRPAPAPSPAPAPPPASDGFEP